MSRQRAVAPGPMIDVTDPEAVKGDAQEEAAIAMGQPVGGLDAPPFQDTPAPVAEAHAHLSEAAKAEQVRQAFPIRPGAPVPIALRSAAERRELQTRGPRRDESAPPAMHVAPPEPFRAPAPALPRDLDSLLKLAAVAAVEAEDDEALDGIRMVQQDRKKRRVGAGGDVGPGTAEGQSRRG